MLGVPESVRATITILVIFLSTSSVCVPILFDSQVHLKPKLIFHNNDRTLSTFPFVFFVASVLWLARFKPLKTSEERRVKEVTAIRSGPIMRPRETKKYSPRSNCHEGINLRVRAFERSNKKIRGDRSTRRKLISPHQA